MGPTVYADGSRHSLVNGSHSSKDNTRRAMRHINQIKARETRDLKERRLVNQLRQMQTKLQELQRKVFEKQISKGQRPTVTPRIKVDRAAIALKKQELAQL